MSEDQLLIADSMTPNDIWHDRQLIGVAPAGTVEARLVVQFVQPNGETGAVHVDSIAFGVSAPVMLPGDYDGNLVVDQLDYVVWKHTYGSDSELDADGNGDNSINAADYVVWRKNIGAAAAFNFELALSVPEPSSLPLAIGGLPGMMGLHVRTIYLRLSPFSPTADFSASRAPTKSLSDGNLKSMD